MPSVSFLEPSKGALSDRWDAFVRSHPSGTFFHLSGWQRVLKNSFGHRGYYLYVEKNGEIVGVLPLVQVRSFLFGSRLTSIPFCVYGGILADDVDVFNTLRSRACEIADHLGVGTLELRSLRPAGDWPARDMYSTFRKTLSPDHTTNLKAIPNRQRAMLRKALAGGLFGESVPGDNGVKRLYRVYSESVRNLGTPVFAIRYLRELKKEFGEDCRVLMIKQSAESTALSDSNDAALCASTPNTDHVASSDVAGVMSFYFRDEVLPYYGGSVSRAREIKGANHFMYWDLMRRSVDEGLEIFDFGRSKAGSGPYSFKSNFGFEPTQLYYEYFLVRDKAPSNLNPNNPKYERLIRSWQRLPLPIANFLGPFVARNLG